MRYYIDTEFIDDGKTIDLISIGIVAEDGREYYAETNEFDKGKASQWVKENVFPHLGNQPPASREDIKQNLLRFMNIEQYGKPELWGWCAAYDWVALCQLFGTMMDVPHGWPHYIRDLQYILDEHQVDDSDLPEQEEGLHNALADAWHVKKLWGYIVRNDAWQ